MGADHPDGPTSAACVERRPWRYDLGHDDTFWFVSDDPASDKWIVTMRCHLTGAVKTEPPDPAFVNFFGRPRRNAWAITPFTEFGYATILVRPDGNEPFIAVKGHLVVFPGPGKRSAVA